MLSSSAKSAILGETDTTWHGVKLMITELVRIDSTHALAVVILSAGSSASDFTSIGEFPKTFITPKNVSREELDSGKYSAQPYSLTGAQLFDEGTKQSFQALKELPENPYFAPNSIVKYVRRNQGVLLSVLFNVAPPQPAGSDGKTPPQLVTIRLPRATKAIEHLLLPPPAPAPTPAQPGATSPAQPTTQASPR